MVCKVLPTGGGHNQIFSVIVNMLLGILSLSSLLIKRKWFDKRKRSNHVFFLDAARLAIAGGFGHILNILLASALDDTGLKDQCKFYLVNYMIDLLIGVPLSYIIILGNTIIAERFGWISLRRKGFYGRPIDYSVWAKQTLEFTFSLALAKVLLAIPLFTFKADFEIIGGDLVRPVDAHPHFELFFVMILVPVSLNSLQFVIFDQILQDEYPPYEIESGGIIVLDDEAKAVVQFEEQQEMQETRDL
jgi:hypothetical protein